MKKILLWIGMGCAVYVPLVASSGGHNKKALVVAGYVREKSAHYMPPYLLDCIYRYWMTDHRTKIGDALPLKGIEDVQPFNAWALLPPSTLVEVYEDNDQTRFLQGWDVHKSHRVFKKALPYKGNPRSMLYIPHDQGDCVVVHYDRKKFVCFWLKRTAYTLFGNAKEDQDHQCFFSQMVKAPDSKGFVSVESGNTIKYLTYWDVGTWKLGTCFNLAKDLSNHGLKRLRPDRMVSFIDADRFALLASYDALREGTNFYVYHRHRKDVVKKVYVKMNTSFDTYHFKESCRMGSWIVVPVTKSFWVYNMLDRTQSCVSYPWRHEKLYKAFPLGESQFLLITNHEKEQGTMYKAAICELETLGASTSIRTWDTNVLDENVRTLWSKDRFVTTYLYVVVLGIDLIFKRYWDDTMAVHTLT